MPLRPVAEVGIQTPTGGITAEVLRGARSIPPLPSEGSGSALLGTLAGVVTQPGSLGEEMVSGWNARCEVNILRLTRALASSEEDESLAQLSEETERLLAALTVVGLAGNSYTPIQQHAWRRALKLQERYGHYRSLKRLKDVLSAWTDDGQASTLGEFRQWAREAADRNGRFFSTALKIIRREVRTKG
ncbi:MAG TPA: hypothetical protein VEY30_01110 [Myxococcaceae bacterium]|nr:hypothetical protein [Myxococcaceae bacterium]